MGYYLLYTHLPLLLTYLRHGRSASQDADEWQARIRATHVEAVAAYQSAKEDGDEWPFAFLFA